MSTFEWAVLAVAVAFLGFLWTLHRDMASVRERLAKLEGSVDTLTRFLIDRERPAAGE
ncbi:MAG: hypothetical protein OXI64_06560 [Defluviicoccus sp.]|nr:hypothetical protein [Defluviicoccus sp.]